MNYTAAPVGASGWGRRRRLSLLLPALAALIPAMAFAQGAAVGADTSDTSGVVEGLLTGAADGQPVPFATVTLLEGHRSVFADARGAFRIGRIMPATYTLRIRQIGYAPKDTSLVVRGGDEGPTPVAVRLQRIALALGRVDVTGRRGKGCVATGVPDSTANPTLAAIFAQVRENVDRFRLLLDDYPFQFTREQRRVLRLDPGGDQVQSIDTASYESRDRRPYHVGGVIYEDYDALAQRHRFMYLPTFRDLADTAFLAAHCFAYGGTSALGPDGNRVIRIDFRPATSIAVPDVEGSILLDAHRFVVRRATFRMTKPGAADPPVLGLSVTTTFRELVPLVPLFDSVESEERLPSGQASEQALPIPGESGQTESRPVRRTAVEDDRLLTYTFEGRVPGDTTAAGVVARAPRADDGHHPSEASSRPSTAAAPVLGAAPVPGITGRVVQADGTAIDGATVGIFSTGDTILTSDSGRFALRDTTPGARMLWVRHVGFRPVRLPVTITRGRANELTITLVRGAATLPRVTTTARTAAAYHDVGLDKRMKAGVGQFVTYQEIARRQALRFTQLVELLRGVHMLSYTYADPAEQASGTRGAGSCIGLMVDGVRQPMLRPHDIDQVIPAKNVAAIEFYRGSEVPTEWKGDAPVGDSLPTVNAYFGTPSRAGSPADAVASAVFKKPCDVMAIWTKTRLGLSGGEGPAGTPQADADTHGQAVFPNPLTCEPQPAEDTIDLAVYATLESNRARAPTDSVWSTYQDRVLTALRDAYLLPTDPALPTFGYPFRAPRSMAAGRSGAATAVAPAFSTVVAFDLDSVGGLSGLRLAASSLAGTADTSVLAGVSAAAFAHAFPAMPGRERGHGPVRFDLVVSTTVPSADLRSLTVGRLSVPAWPLRRPVALAQGLQPDLAPQKTSHAMRSDSALFEFVVDDRGRVQVSTARVIGAAGTEGTGFVERRFVDRVARALPDFRFDPALIGACPVRQMVTQAFGWRQY